MRPVPGICDRCGLRYNLSDLSEEYLLDRPTGIVVCYSCYDESHPQLDTRGLQTNDKQQVEGHQSDVGEREESRRLSGWNPVGAEATSTLQTYVGRVMVMTTVGDDEEPGPGPDPGPDPEPEPGNGVSVPVFSDELVAALGAITVDTSVKTLVFPVGLSATTALSPVGVVSNTFAVINVTGFGATASLGNESITAIQNRTVNVTGFGATGSTSSVTVNTGSGGFNPINLNETNTGYLESPGLLTTVATITTTANNQVIEYRRVTDRITINHTGCTVRKCIIESDGFYGIVQNSGSNVLVEDCTFVGQRIAIAATGTFRRNNIHTCENGIVCWGHNVHISRNYIHDLGWPGSGSDPHNDNIENSGQNNVIITENKILGTNVQDNAAIYTDDEFSGSNPCFVGSSITNNYFGGGNYALYVDGDNSANTISPTYTVTGNTVYSGMFGYWYLVDAGAVLTEGYLNSNNTLI